MNDSLADEIARLEAEIEQKRLQKQLEDMAAPVENEEEVETSEEEEEEELIVLTAPKSKMGSFSDHSRNSRNSSVQEEHKMERQSSSSSNPAPPPKSLGNNGQSAAGKSPGSAFGRKKAPVRRSVLLRSVTKAASERSDDSESNIREYPPSKSPGPTNKPSDYGTAPSTPGKNVVKVQQKPKTPLSKGKSPVRRSVFLNSVVEAASERDFRPEASQQGSDMELAIQAAMEADEEEEKQERHREAEERRNEELERQRIQAEMKQLEEATARAKQKRQEELERMQAEGARKAAAKKQQEEQQRQAAEAERRSREEAQRKAKAEEQRRREAERQAREAEQQKQEEHRRAEKEAEQRREEERLKLEAEIKAMEAAVAAKATKKKVRRAKPNTQRQQLEDEIRKVEAEAAEAERKRNADLELQRIQEEIRTMEEATAKAREKRATELQQLHAEHEKAVEPYHIAPQRKSGRASRRGSFFSNVGDEVAKDGQIPTDTKDLERQRLEEEIRQMEEQMKRKQQMSLDGGSVSSRMSRSSAGTSGSRRKVKKGTSQRRMSQKELERTKLEEEIAKMEEQIKGASSASTEDKATTPKPPAAGPPRPAFLAGISGAAADHNRRSGVEETSTTAESTGAKSNQPGLFSAISGAAVAREKRIGESGGELKVREASTEAPSAPPGRPNFLAGIAGAAQAREKRVEDGESQMREVEPEVAEQRQGTPQLSFALAEMVSKGARDRDKRLADGGEKKMTKIKEKEEYKKVFNNVAMEAASMGRLTRLNESFVEAVAKEKTPEQEWKSQGLLAITWRSNHMSIIHEAAALGNETKMREKVVSNFPEEEDDWQALEDAEGSSRLQQLLELNTQAGTGTEKVDKLVMGLREENQGGESMIVRPMQAYSKIEDVKLPKPLPPSIDLIKAKAKVKKMEEDALREHRPMVDISSHVAEVVWERRARLNRPGSMPKVREACLCGYCGTASPYQTHAYREIEKRHKHELKQQSEVREAEFQARREEIQRLRMNAVPEDVEEEQLKENTVPTANVPKTSAGDKLRQKLEAKKTGKTAPKAVSPVAKPPVATTTAKKESVVVKKEPSTSIQRVGTAKPSQANKAAEQGCACVIL